MSEINDLQNITHQYRQSLEAFEERTNKQARMIDLAGNGEERQTMARMDADLSAIEQRMQDMAAAKAAAEHRAAALEAKLAEPTYRAKPTDAKIVDRSSEEYAARWLKAVATGDAGEMRALSLGSGGAGIPTDMERRIVDRMFQANVMRQICPVSTIDSKRTIPVQNALPTTALVAEAGTITPADPTFSTAISVVPYKLVTAVTMSQEFIEDAIGNGGIGSGLQYVADKCGLVDRAQAGGVLHGRHRKHPAAGNLRHLRRRDAGRRPRRCHHHAHLGRGHRRGARGAGRVPQFAAVPLACLGHRAEGDSQAQGQRGLLRLQPRSVDQRDQRRRPARHDLRRAVLGRPVRAETRTARATASPSSATSTTSKFSTAPASPRWWIPTRRR
jgi:hypothetical protein